MANPTTNYVVNGKAYYRKYANIGGVRKMVYGKSIKDWQKKVDKLKLEAAMGLITTNSTLGEAFEEWFYLVYANRKNIKKSTIATHDSTYRSLLKDDALMNVNLTELKSISIIQYADRLAKTGKSEHRIHSAISLLSMFCKFALNEGYLLRNPCANIEKPSLPEKKDIEILSDEEIVRIKTALTNDRLEFMFLLMLATGMRIGEVLALRHNDFGKKIKISKQQQMIRHVEKGKSIRYEISDVEPKTKESKRTIPIPESIQERYPAFKQQCKLEKFALGNGALKDDDLMFLSVRGLRCRASQIRKDWIKILEKAGVEYRSPHSLRHTYITKLVQANVPIVTVMELAGHSRIETTLRYTHIEEKDKTKAISIIDSIIR